MDFCEEKYKNNEEYRKEYLNSLTEMIKNNELFENLDRTIVTYLFHSCYGIYGSEMKELSTQILKEFVKWAKKKPTCYICFNDEPMFHQSLMEQLLEWCDKTHENNMDEKNMNEMLKDFKNKQGEIMVELYLKTKEEYDNKMNDILSTPRLNFYDTNEICTPSLILKWYIIGSMIGYIIGYVFKIYS
jgi:hypothetical protein